VRSTVKLREQDGRFVLDLNWVQADLVMRVMVVYLGHPRAEAADRVLVGAPRRDAIAIADRIGPNEEHRAVTLDLSPAELHLVHATLAAAYASVTSQEDFHLKTGFFPENVQAFLLGLARALADL
jgi:hypothetical protein